MELAGYGHRVSHLNKWLASDHRFQQLLSGSPSTCPAALSWDRTAWPWLSWMMQTELLVYWPYLLLGVDDLIDELP